MANHGLQRVVDRLRMAVLPELPDAILLREFIAKRDEAAFAALVRRHGPLVFGISRRVLGNAHDSEDVVQATFLVLARKARKVANPEALAAWLLKVAYRISLKAKSKSFRRARMEMQVDRLPEPHTSTPIMHHWEAVLDEELSRLPEMYRLPLILCEMEGRPRAEVARRLELPEGTLSSRLATAKQRLAARMTRRGYALSSTVLALGLSQATAALPAGLAAATVKQGMLVAAGQVAAISSSVMMLMKAGAQTMVWTKLKVALATVVLASAVGAGGLAYSGAVQSGAAEIAAAGEGAAQDARAQQPGELEALRRENELLKLNLKIALEKIQRLQDEILDLRARAGGNLSQAREAPPKTERQTAEVAPKLVRVDPDGDCTFTDLPEIGQHRIAIPGKPHILSAEMSGVLGAAKAANAPRLVTEVAGNFHAEVKVLGPIPSDPRSLVGKRWPYYGAGLLVWQDDKNYLRLARARMYSPDTKKWLSYVGWELRRNGQFVRGNANDEDPLDENKPAFFRLDRQGDKYTASYRQNGKEWKELVPMETDLAKELKVGACAMQNTPAGFEAVFQGLKVTSAKKEPQP